MSYAIYLEELKNDNYIICTLCTSDLVCEDCYEELVKHRKY